MIFLVKHVQSRGIARGIGRGTARGTTAGAGGAAPTNFSLAAASNARPHRF